MLTRNEHKKWRLNCKVRHFVEGMLFYCIPRCLRPKAWRQPSIITSRRSLIYIKVPLGRFTLTPGHSITCPKLSVRDPGRTGSRVCYRWCSMSDLTGHPAIGDAIDEDGSGYLSVLEVDRFFQKKPKGWSSSGWIA